GIVPESHQERVALTLSSWTPPPSMSCVLEEQPYVLPEPSQLLDVDELSGDLAQMWTALARPNGYVLLSVGYGATGRPDRLHLIETTLADSTLARDIAQLVDTRLNRPEPSDPFGVRLRVTLGEEPAVEVGRREACFPNWAEAPTIGTLDNDPGTDDAREQIRAGDAALRVYMSPDGEVSDAYALGRMPQSSTIGDLIAASRESGLTETALLDRTPAGFWFTMRTEDRNRVRVARGGS